MKATIIMLFDGEGFEYGTYPYNTNEEKNKVNELAMKIREERDCSTYIKVVD